MKNLCSSCNKPSKWPSHLCEDCQKTVIEELCGPDLDFSQQAARESKWHLTPVNAKGSPQDAVDRQYNGQWPGNTAKGPWFKK